MTDNWTVNHVGFVVPGKNAVLRYFQSLGVGVSVGPQPLLPHEEGHGALTYYRTLNGDPVTNTYPTGGAHTFNDGESQIGDCQLECLTMKAGPGSFMTEYIEQKGPGINHICFNVPDVEAETKKLLDKGCGVVFEATVNGKIVENYLDTRLHGDLMISLRPPPTDWELTWKANNQVHPLVNDWIFRGVGIGVEDLAATIEYYEFLGFAETETDIEDTVPNTTSRSVQVGPLTFEFFQQTSGSSVYQDSLDTRQDGINDLTFEVVDLESAIARLVDRGAKLLLEEASGTRNYAYFDTRKVGNLMIRLVQN